MRQPLTEEAAIAAEIARIRSLALDALRRGWRAEFGRTPPTGLSRDLLGRMIAWRLQERAFGGLDHDSLAFLDRLARQSGSRRRQLKPGTVLVREYQCQRHSVVLVRGNPSTTINATISMRDAGLPYVCPDRSPKRGHVGKQLHPRKVAETSLPKNGDVRRGGRNLWTL